MKIAQRARNNIYNVYANDKFIGNCALLDANRQHYESVLCFDENV